MKQIVFGLVLALAAGSVGLVLCGCETDPSSDAEVVITPSSATLSVGQSVELTASGWTGYRWSLSDGSIGTLSRRTGERVTYTSVASGGSNAVQTVTATGTGTGGNSDTNQQGYVVAGYATIRHL